MILGLFGALIVILIMILMAYTLSLAITFWFISIPLFVGWVWWSVKHQKTRPPLSPRAQAQLDMHNARNAWEKDLNRRQRKGLA